MRLVISLLLIPLALMGYQQALADETTYLCKVSGRFNDYNGSGKISESISMTINNLPKVTLVTTIGSEHTQFNMHAENVSEPKTYEGQISTDTSSNLSHGEEISIYNSSSYKQQQSGFINRFAFNKKTKVMSYTRDYIQDNAPLEKTNFSGTCVKQ